MTNSCIHSFSKKKFFELSLNQQHKKLAEMLRTIYEGMITNTPTEKTFLHYNEILLWMKQKPLQNRQNSKLIADRYHKHLHLAKVYSQEHNLLPKIEHHDKHSNHLPLPISIYLDHLRSAHNVGSILRTTEALSLGSIYFSATTPFIDNKKVQKTSMNTWQWVSCFKGIPLKHLPKPVIVLETSPQAFNLHQFIFPETFTLVVGNEEYGCSDETLQLADYLLKIPTVGRKNSINVANAFAITAGAIQRQELIR